MTDLPARFRDAFWDAAQTGELALKLKTAVSAGSRAVWTRALTDAAMAACRNAGLVGSAKWHKMALLPISRNEYLSLDGVGFASGEKRWRFPALVMEFENSNREDHIAYSLWKVLSVRAELRVVFCYRKNREDIPGLLRHLRAEVVDAMGLAGRVQLDGRTLLVVGTRNESEAFPYGYFNWWELNTNTGSFERF